MALHLNMGMPVDKSHADRLILPHTRKRSVTADEQQGASEEKSGAMKACIRRCNIHGLFLFESFFSRP
jgi:hypothetical protein